MIPTLWKYCSDGRKESCCRLLRNIFASGSSGRLDNDDDLRPGDDNDNPIRWIFWGGVARLRRRMEGDARQPRRT